MAAIELGPETRPIDIVFSHANGFNARTYRSILEPLAAGLRILAPDLRGHGATQLPIEMDGRIGWDDMRDDLLALLQALDLENVVLSGHSLGASLSLLAAARAPQRVRSLVLLEPVILRQEDIALARRGGRLHGPMSDRTRRRRTVFPDRQSAFDAYHGRAGFKTWSDAMLADYVAAGFRDLPNGDVELACSPAWEACSYAAQANDVWEALEQTRCPIRIVKAEQGSSCVLTPEQAAQIAPGRIEIETVPGTTHFLPMERPDVVRGALRAATDR